mgnify:CR=1 FL=1
MRKLFKERKLFKGGNYMRKYGMCDKKAKLWELYVLFVCFSYIFRSDVVFLKTKNRIVFMLILEGPHVAISLVLVNILKIHTFRRCVFNEFLWRFQWKNHVHWWSPRLKNSGNPCAKLIFLVFSICSIVKDLEKHEKIMTFRRPYGVTHKGFSVIVSDFHQDFKVDIWKSGFSRIALELTW